MATKVRLLSTYKGYRPQTILSLPDAEANALLAGGIGATTVLTGGTAAYQPADYASPTPLKDPPPNQTVPAGKQVTLTVPMNTTISLIGSTDVEGTREVLALDGTVSSTTPLQSGGGLSMGPYVNDTNVRLTVLAGSVGTKLQAPTTPAFGGALDIGPSVPVPAGSTDFILRGAGNGSLGDVIRAIRFTVTGAATTVTLTDGDGTPYPDPSGTPGLLPNPFNAKQILGPNAVAPLDLPMYDQPSYNGPWKVTTGANVSLQVFGTFS